MANTPQIAARLERPLLDDATAAAVEAGLPAHVSVAEVVRFAVALLAKRPDPRQVAMSRPGPKAKEKAGGAA